MKILSFGAGALGTYVGGSLALAGEKLVFLEQPAVARELRRAGLHLDLAIDRRRKSAAAPILPPNAFEVVTSLQAALDRDPFDVAIFALKSFDTTAALRSIEPVAAKMPAVCCMSNGVDNEPALAEVLGADKVIAATVTTAIGRRGPGSIVLEKLRGIGIASTHPLSHKLIASANAALLNARPFANAASMKWSKLLTNLIANATSAILDMTAADILGNSKLYPLEIGMLRECLAVMHAQGIPVVDLPGSPVLLLECAVRLPMWLSKPLISRVAGSGRGRKMPSFHIDLHSGRRNSEVEYLNGAVVRAGRKFGIPTPINKVLTDTLMALASREMPLDEFSHQPRKLLAALQ